MPRTRQGLNCTLSYLKGRSRSAYRVRASMLAHGMQIVFDESQARVRRAFYPHRLSSAQFAITIDLVGEQERDSFVSWLSGYADHVLDPDLKSGEFPSMAVSIPSYNFLRKGVPLTGYDWSDTVGQMLWTIPVLFETAGEPGEKDPRLSSVQGSALYGNETRYFYPTGIQLAGDDTPPDGTYQSSIRIEDILPPTPVSRSLKGGQVKDA